MSENSQHTPNSFLTVIGVLIGLCLMGWLVVGSGEDDKTTGIGSARALERKEALVELRETTAEQLVSYGVVNEANEVYQIPVERAMEMIVNEWQNPEEGRQQMLVRSEKAFFVPAVVEAPNPFE